MKVCEGCIKQDTCKFRKEVERFEKVEGILGKHPFPEPLEAVVTCKYKLVEEDWEEPVYPLEFPPFRPMPTWSKDYPAWGDYTTYGPNEWSYTA